jgi:hypothetical protein
MAHQLATQRRLELLTMGRRSWPPSPCPPSRSRSAPCFSPVLTKVSDHRFARDRQSGKRTWLYMDLMSYIEIWLSWFVKELRESMLGGRQRSRRGFRVKVSGRQQQEGCSGRGTPSSAKQSLPDRSPRPARALQCSSPGRPSSVGCT